MNFYINFGNDKNKWNHISKFGNKKKLEFSIVVAQLNKRTNSKEYAYIKAETWDWNIIQALEENKKYKIEDFYLRFYQDKDNKLNWVIVIKALKNIQQEEQEKNQEIDINDLNEIFNSNEENQEIDNPFELDI